jgi:hypothetical protein
MMEFMTTLAEHWQEIVAGGIIAMAAFGKLAEIVIKTLGNVRDTWVDTFGPKDKKVRIDWDN